MWMTVSAAEEERCSKERCFSDGFDVCLGGGSRIHAEVFGPGR